MRMLWFVGDLPEMAASASRDWSCDGNGPRPRSTNLADDCRATPVSGQMPGVKSDVGAT
jgi:hypothetical protein